MIQKCHAGAKGSLLLPLTGIASHPQSYSTYLGTYIWMQDLKNKIQKGKGDF